MVMSLVRFNQVQPGLDPEEMADRYQASVDMAAYADEHGLDMVTLEEHHGADNGWSPSPLVSAGLVFGRCPRIPITVMALLLPLHDPIRLAEDIAVLDLASGGRLTVVGGLGYRPEEYAAHGKSWAERGRLMDEAVDTMLKAWTGEPFEYRGTEVRVTPKPLTQPHPTLLIGGTSKPSARRAARFGLPLAPAANLPELESYYYEQCQAAGTQGVCIMPPGQFSTTYVADDPARAWNELGQYFLHEATVYANWQTPDIHSAVHSHAGTVDELRAEGIYEVLTPDECVARATEAGEAATFALHPLVGGMPIDKGWECLTLYVEQVLPRLAG
ncbi:MAG TPA: LLM class flavin-dependent oxidoreductase [Acidimicrobiales bacterium]|jgi:alkanesulfonate monooxygenase SsuD/methylene tetrahydromethanopterin reductase-like flavin-dependent oxidoreductase (luciferase family)|nr:LLM class flavin-dependent oxidoreductase [Acidimicrobiales bacterium]